MDQDGFEGILANGIPHQAFPICGRAARSVLPARSTTGIPGHTFDDVLIIGAGTGNDTAMAVRVATVTSTPSRSTRRSSSSASIATTCTRTRTRGSTRTVDDGRAFLRTTDQKYDLIMLAQTDSLTLFSTTGNIRLESFLFTREAFADIRDHLKPDGMMVLYNLYWQDWAVDRLGWMLEDTFGRPTIIARYGTGPFHAAVLANGPGLSGSLGVPAGAEVMRVATRRR